MKEEITYQWTCHQLGKWFTTRYHCTEESIRKEHPEAVPIVSSRVARMVPSTPQECHRAMVENSTSGVSKARLGPDGQTLRMWEGV
jgi:hypothetical protein